MQRNSPLNTFRPSPRGRGMQKTFQRYAQLSEPRRIYARDPEAPELIAARLQELREKQGRMTRVNALVRRSDRGELAEMGFSAAELAKLLKRGAGGQSAFTDHEIRSNAAHIRRLEMRMKEIEARAAGEPVHIDAGDYTYIEEDGKVLFRFATKPGAAVRQVLAEYGFKLSTARGAYVRALNTPALAAARCVRCALGVAR